MSRFRLGHVPLVFSAIARWLVGTGGGRKLLVIVVGLPAAAAALVVASSPAGSEAAKRRAGTWSGLYNEYAPNQGELVIEGKPGTAPTCRVRGQTRSAAGDGWVFRGDASVAETACEVRIAKDGRVSGRLELAKKWDGRVKGIGGDDWEERSGTSLCEGDVDGTLSAGGTWKGMCTTDDGKTYASSISWRLSL